MEETPLGSGGSSGDWRDEAIRRVLEELSRPVLEVTDPDRSVELAFAVVHAARAFEYHLGVAARGFDMTAMQARFAWILSTSPWPIPQPNIAVTLGLSQAGVSRMVHRMRARGLVETDIHPSDARTSLVGLTDHGKRQWDLVREQVAAVATELSEALGANGSGRFREDLTRVRRLDERDAWFEALRNPLSILS